MQIIPKAGPQIVAPPQAQAQPQTSARERAIAMIQEAGAKNAQPQESTTVQNASKVSPEELNLVSKPSEPKRTTSQTNTSESQVQSEQAPAAPEPKSDSLNSQFALLARKEKSLRAQAQAQASELKAKEQAIFAREEALKAKEAEYATNYIPKSKLKLDPLSVLTAEGVSYDELTQAILNPRQAQDPRIVAELEQLKAEVKKSQDLQEQTRKAYEDQQKQVYQQAVNQIHKDAVALVNSDSSFETIKATGNAKEITRLIEKVYHKDGIMLTVEEAAREVEEHLVEKYSGVVSRVEKLKARLSPKEQLAQQSQEPKQPQQEQTMKTLTNAVNASKTISARDRAILAFKNELK